MLPIMSTIAATAPQASLTVLQSVRRQSGWGAWLPNACGLQTATAAVLGPTAGLATSLPRRRSQSFHSQYNPAQEMIQNHTSAGESPDTITAMGHAANSVIASRTSVRACISFLLFRGAVSSANGTSVVEKPRVTNVTRCRNSVEFSTTES